uniref:H15 domain-containing protein n=1 Tax=Callorhinchus milii TaxID=7868 RepID=A0A4W3GHW8_CALMI
STAAAAASPETAQKQVDPLLESSFKLMEVIHQIASNAEQRNGMSVVAIKKALDAKGYKTVTHKFLISSSLKGLTEKSFRTHTKGISVSYTHERATRQIIRPLSNRFSKAKSPGAKMTEKPIAYNKPKPTKTRKMYSFIIKQSRAMAPSLDAKSKRQNKCRLFLLLLKT